MTREELLRCPEYWTTLIQNELYRQIQSYMDKNNMNKAQLAEHLGCSRGYVTQLLNGDFDHKISKLVELSLAIGMAPSVSFKELEHVDDRVSFECKGVIEAMPRFTLTRNRMIVIPAQKYNQSVNGYTNSSCFEQKVG